MSVVAKYDAYRKKVENICDENNLTYKIQTKQYPITLTIQPLCGLDEQTSMLSAAESGSNSPDAAISFMYMDGALAYKTSETFSISDALFNKIKNLFKNLCMMWLHYFFAEVISRGTIKITDVPDIDEEAELADVSEEVDDE